MRLRLCDRVCDRRSHRGAARRRPTSRKLPSKSRLLVPCPPKSQTVLRFLKAPKAAKPPPRAACTRNFSWRPRSQNMTHMLFNMTPMLSFWRLQVYCYIHVVLNDMYVICVLEIPLGHVSMKMTHMLFYTTPVSSSLSTG